MSFFSFLFGRSRRRAAAEHAGRGNALAERGEFGDALKEYDEAHRLDPGAANVRSRRAGVYFNTGRHDDALAEAIATRLTAMHSRRGFPSLGLKPAPPAPAKRPKRKAK
ncbi:MAG TPA: tetratricopeptide repeat protein [Gemmataceae bacterium]|nr:tetratricopeptide repeat protein [Gemmataceae bacterium]